MTGKTVSAITQQSRPEGDVSAAFPQVRHYLDDLLSGYQTRYDHLHTPLRALITRGRQTPHELSLPLLVHAAVRGAPEPAVPVAAVHTLWWRAANTFDDIVDGDAGTRLYGLPHGIALTAALECGYALPLRALASMPLPEARRQALIREYLDGWTTACDGQIGDVLHHPADVEPETVLHVYRRKSAALYAMACSMAARVAEATHLSGAPAVRVPDWARFGHVLGMLAQFRNDEDDLRSGQCEDLRNQRATYMLVLFLRSASPDRRAQALRLLESARASAASRQELLTMLRDPEVVARYHAHIHTQKREALALIESLAPRSPYAPALRALVHSEVGFLPSEGQLDHSQGH
ncbi:polyprenyl synthetase family protein [Streptomyces sp. RGM 3693]|uniref:polyprenyl synthetase family protein n=1 Tax=Streptomyces sp. RGM 3693 TaxID=3413284 RepID=UPI003D2D33F4